MTLNLRQTSSRLQFFEYQNELDAIFHEITSNDINFQSNFNIKYTV